MLCATFLCGGVGVVMRTAWRSFYRNANLLRHVARIPSAFATRYPFLEETSTFGFPKRCKDLVSFSFLSHNDTFRFTLLVRIFYSKLKYFVPYVVIDTVIDVHWVESNVGEGGIVRTACRCFCRNSKAIPSAFCCTRCAFVEEANAFSLLKRCRGLVLG